MANSGGAAGHITLLRLFWILFWAVPAPTPLPYNSSLALVRAKHAVFHHPSLIAAFALLVRQTCS